MSDNTTTETEESLARIKRRITAVGGVRTLPQIAAEVMRISRDPSSSMREMASVISKDPPLTGRLLKVANSAFYGLSQHVGSLNTALVLLGMKNIKNIVMSISIFRVMGSSGQPSAFNRQGFWEHSGACASACQLLEKKLKLDLGGEGFVTGLIHDLGKITMDSVFHKDFLEAVALASREQLPMHSAEKQVMGVDHAQVGGWLAEKWNFPQDISSAIANHHAGPPDPQKQVLSATLQAANTIVHIKDFGFAGFAPPPSMEEVERLPLFAQKQFPWEEFSEELEEEFEGVQEFLKALSG